MSRALWSGATQAFAADQYLSPLIKKIPPPRLAAKADPFHALIVAILNQLISRSVAQVIQQRLVKLTGTPFTPEAILAASDAKMRNAGLSTAKTQCAKACAQMALITKFSGPACRRLSDSDIRQQVVSIKGIGNWSADMVLIFGLGRADIMPYGDAGIQRAARNIFALSDNAAALAKLQRVAPRWSPHRSVAAWYLWRLLG